MNKPRPFLNPSIAPFEETATQVFDRTGWPDGPWVSEPDLLVFTTSSGLPGLILRHPVFGCLRGYVGVYPGHPYYGFSYDRLLFLRVHGGVTGSAAGSPFDGPAPLALSMLFWIGFDCGHAGDFKPLQRGGFLAGMQETFDLLEDVFEGASSSLPVQPAGIAPGVYRDVAYVRSEIGKLATQLIEVGGGSLN